MRDLAIAHYITVLSSIAVVCMKQQLYTGTRTVVVECPCGLVVKFKCISLYQLQYLL